MICMYAVGIFAQVYVCMGCSFRYRNLFTYHDALAYCCQWLHSGTSTLASIPQATRRYKNV